MSRAPNLRAWVQLGFPEAALAIFATAGAFKADDRLAWLPIDLTVGAAILSVLLLILRTVHTPHVPRNMLLIMALFVVFCPALFVTDWNPYATEKAQRFYALTLPACVAACILLRSAKNGRRWINALCLIGAIVAADGVTRWIGGGAMARLSGFNATTITFARMVSLPALWLCCLALNKKLNAILAAAGVVAFGLLSVASGSRTPLLALGGTILVVASIKLRKRDSRRQLFALAVIVGAILLAVTLNDLLPSESRERILGSFHGELDDSGRIRLELFSVSMDYIKRYPQGLGFGGLMGRVGDVGDQRVFSHNLILEAGVEGGWIAGVYIVFLFGFALWRARRLVIASPRRSEYLFYFAALIFLMANDMLSGELNDSRLLFMFLGIVVTVKSESRSVSYAGNRPRLVPVEG
ncbi:MAG: O-antigen ligase family protein [Bryobacteraceae bacterium]|jgi:O-antigen ligase